MSTPRFKKILIAGFIVCAFLAFLLGRLGDGFNTRWRNLKDGMTQAEVAQALGPPTWAGKTLVKGAGDQEVTRWQYKRGRCTYCVDFDYTGPGGAPVVYRTEHFREEFRWPAWFPWQPGKTRA